MSSGQPGTRSLIVGASGQVGTQILSALRTGTAIPTSRLPERAGWIELDLASISTTQAEELISDLKIDTIYCVGGMTNVDGCESTPQLAMRTNCEGPAILASAAAKHAVHFVYFSTDYVFNGHGGPYTEDAPGDPISVYGKSKWSGETAVRASHPGALIIRTTGVYGPDPKGKNFLYSLRNGLSAGKPFLVPADQVSTPTYNADLATAVVALVESGATGVFHVAGPDLVSRLEFAQRAAKAMGMLSSSIVGQPTSELRQAAPRPLRSGLLTGKLMNYLPRVRMRSIEEAVSDWNTSTGGLRSTGDPFIQVRR